ncbi:16S rRNA (cytidine1402-2'-O)-methyltransferase [Parelusimicrobium proximum]|uniref:16S rRNA (cytidine(1402)-2'-O)-methyltransferase n=1 Tax=Parelusimicrobium proximum TaxID=3228953 RepID=UPI003D184948
MLYVVPTPIGNMEDITLRALNTLKSCDAVLAEDTRHTGALLSKLGINKPVIRYNENNPASIDSCLRKLTEGKTCALVSDCGTPAVSDPGWRLVKAARDAGIKVTALPGPCAFTTAFSAAGLGGGGMVFLGFLPRKTGKIVKNITAALETGRPVIIYESPYRVLKLLTLIAGNFGPDTQVVAAREISKVYEEYITGTAQEVKQALEKKSKILGEFVIIISPHETAEQDTDEE